MEIERVKERRRERVTAPVSRLTVSNLPSRRHRTRLAQPHSARCRAALPSLPPKKSPLEGDLVVAAESAEYEERVRELQDGGKEGGSRERR
ncbi:uncharacterized protein DS421_12g383090 [Arachis hypogaea]|nr:uncharacterized protein DS421_12g383090 [Arachis hypogaea]